MWLIYIKSVELCGFFFFFFTIKIYKIVLSCLCSKVKIPTRKTKNSSGDVEVSEQRCSRGEGWRQVPHPGGSWVPAKHFHPHFEFLPPAQATALRKVAADPSPPRYLLGTAEHGAGIVERSGRLRILSASSWCGCPALSRSSWLRLNESSAVVWRFLQLAGGRAGVLFQGFPPPLPFPSVDPEGKVKPGLRNALEHDDTLRYPVVPFIALLSR